MSGNLWVNGRACDATHLDKLTHEADLWSLQWRDALMDSSRRWDVDDWLLDPEGLLEGVDPESNRFGVISGLKLWLKLEAQGLMEHRFAKPDRRAVFQASLEAEKTV